VVTRQDIENEAGFWQQLIREARMKNRERIPPGEFTDALTAANLEFAGLSWSGFNVFGDPASIAEVQRMQHLADIVPQLQERNAELVERINELQAEAASWAAATERME
jgi:hypothetical protein